LGQRRRVIEFIDWPGGVLILGRSDGDELK